MSRDKLRRLLVLLHAETQSPGPRAGEVIAKLRELAALYEQAGAAPRPTDRGLLRALELMQARPAERWTVAALARAAGMSRAVFARKFAAAFATSPLRYLHEQRMERAAALLADPGAALAAVAREVGYGSEWAFGRAFKRHHGVAPGTYRRRAAVPATAFARPRMAMAA